MSDDIDDLLDGKLDDLADMPEFKPYPAGAHKCKVNFESKKIADFPAIEVTLTAVETLELNNTDDKPLAAGDVTNVAYFLKHSNPKVAELGQGKFKELMKAMATQYPAEAAVSTRELMKAANGSEVVVVTGVRSNKEKTKSYTDIVEMGFA